MMLSTYQVLLTIVVVGLCTLLTRALPFLLFPGNKPTPSYITYLGKVLPYATVGLLVVYCLRGTTPTVYPFGIPELASVAVVVGLQLWKQKALLSVGCGTALYMLLVQTVFA